MVSGQAKDRKDSKRTVWSTLSRAAQDTRINSVLRRKTSLVHSTCERGQLSHCNLYQKFSCPSEYGNRIDEKAPSEADNKRDYQSPGT